MKDNQDVDDLIDSLTQSVPAVDASAKKRAIALAMAEFDRAKNQPTHTATELIEKKSFSFQGFLRWCRLRGSNPQSPLRSDTMKVPSKKMLIGSLATASIAAVGLIMLQKPNSPVIETTQVPLVIEENYVAPQTQASPSVVGQVNDELLADRKEEAPLKSVPSIATEAQEKKAQYAMDSVEIEEEVVLTGNMAPAKPALASAPQPVIVGIVAPSDKSQLKPAEFRDRFEEFKDNSVKSVAEEPVSTFSIDVDTASYSFVRRMLNNGQLPAKDSVRSEELINYFDYQYPLSSSRKIPFTTTVNLLDSPWKKGNKLIHVAIQGYQLPAKEIPQSNLVFLLDVSGSMDEPDKLPLVKQSMSLLLDTLRPDDTISIVVYAGAAGTVLEPTKAKDKTKILSALNNLQAGGSTAGAEGIELAYQLAEANFNPNGVNRIILATDGDFNLGQTEDIALQDFVERKREKGIFLSVLGFGQGNYQDAMMQTLAQNGNGTAAYIDTLSEAQKVLVTEATSHLFPIAKDVKIQVEFNPNTVSEYRLIGYETRSLNREDFANDKIDAGEIGAGQRVTAIYEITPNGEKGLLEPSRYQTSSTASDKQTNEYAFVRLRYKLPQDNKSTLVETPVLVKAKEANAAVQSEVKFGVAVAGFAQLLRGGQFMENFSYDDVITLAQDNKGKDEFGYRNEFIQLVRKAKIAK